MDPVLLPMTGGKDRLSDPLDVELLLKALPRQHVVAWENEWNYEHLVRLQLVLRGSARDVCL